MRATERLLQLWRDSGSFSAQVARNGFYQANAEGAELIRLHVDPSQGHYPTMSGHKSRFAIRFMPLDSENGQVPERLDFELACC